MGRSRSAFSESKHPRGRPGNAGQFRNKPRPAQPAPPASARRGRQDDTPAAYPPIDENAVRAYLDLPGDTQTAFADMQLMETELQESIDEYCSMIYDTTRDVDDDERRRQGERTISQIGTTQNYRFLAMAHESFDESLRKLMVQAKQDGEAEALDISFQANKDLFEGMLEGTRSTEDSRKAQVAALHKVLTDRSQSDPQAASSAIVAEMTEYMLEDTISAAFYGMLKAEEAVLAEYGALPPAPEGETEETVVDQLASRFEKAADEFGVEFDLDELKAI